MEMRRKDRNRAGASRWLLPFFAGFVAGVLLWNFGGSRFTEESGILDEATLTQIGGMELNCHAFFAYVLRRRLGALWLLALASSTFAGVYLLHAYAAWLGFSGGVLLSAAAIRYGIRGILLVAVGCLPQYLLYIPAVLAALCTGYAFCTGMRDPPGASRLGQAAGGSRRALVVRSFLVFLLLHGVVITGAALESYVNPDFVTRLLQKF